MNFLKLVEIADFQNGYAFSSKEYVPESNESKEVLRMGYIKRGGGFKEDESKVFAPKGSKGFTKKYMLEQDDIVIAMTDMKNDVKILGCCALVNHNSRFLLNQRVGRIRVKDTNLVNPKYLYYFLNSPDQLRDIRSRANSGVQVNLSTQSIKESLIKIFPKEYQDEIVEVLHNLDNKIELNQKMNETLEDIAKTLFKSWFIDFDPVRAKAEGRPTGLSKEISDLFPDSFEDSELGEIPKGWEIKEINDLCLTTDYVANGSFKTLRENTNRVDSKEEDAAILIRVTDFNSNWNSDFQYIDTDSYEFLEKTKLFPGDLVICNVGDVGKCFLLTDLGRKMSLGPNGILCKDFEEKGIISKEYLFYFLNNRNTQNLLDSISSGSVQDKFNKTQFRSLQALIPTEDLLNSFTRISKAILEKKDLIFKENRTLSLLRDTLMPKLISGELRIPDAEEILEEASV